MFSGRRRNKCILLVFLGFFSYQSFSQKFKFQSPTQIELDYRLNLVKKNWWFKAESDSSKGFLGEVAERGGGAVGSLVAGQTVTQVGDVFEGLFFLVTLRPGKALDHLSNGINPLGLVNSALSDIGACVSSPFCDRGFERPEVQVGLQNISQMFSSEYDHWVNPLTAPINPGKHLGLVINSTGQIRNWGGELNHEKPIYLEKVYDSRDQSELMALARLECASNGIQNSLNFSEDYFLFGYNCGGFVSDVLATAGMNSPVFANCGIGNDLRIGGPSNETLRKVKLNCDSAIDAVPAVLLKLEAGLEVTLEDRKNLVNLHPPAALYMQLLTSAIRGGNWGNIFWAYDFEEPSGIFEITGASSDLVKIVSDLLVANKKVDLSARFEQEQDPLIRRLIEKELKKLEERLPDWEESSFSKKYLANFFWGFKTRDFEILGAISDRVLETFKYKCTAWLAPNEFSPDCLFLESLDPKNISPHKSRLESSLKSKIIGDFLKVVSRSAETKQLDENSQNLLAQNLMDSSPVLNFIRSEPKKKPTVAGAVYIPGSSNYSFVSGPLYLLSSQSSDSNGEYALELSNLKATLGSSEFREQSVLFKQRQRKRLLELMDSEKPEVRNWAVMLLIAKILDPWSLTNMSDWSPDLEKSYLDFSAYWSLDGMIQTIPLLFGEKFSLPIEYSKWLVSKFEGADAEDLGVFFPIFRNLKFLKESHPELYSTLVSAVEQKAESVATLGWKDLSLKLRELLK